LKIRDFPDEFSLQNELTWKIGVETKLIELQIDKGMSIPEAATK
jgi:hypothetical protein